MRNFSSIFSSSFIQHYKSDKDRNCSNQLLLMARICVCIMFAEGWRARCAEDNADERRRRRQTPRRRIRPHKRFRIWFSNSAIENGKRKKKATGILNVLSIGIKIIRVDTTNTSAKRLLLGTFVLLKKKKNIKESRGY